LQGILKQKIKKIKIIFLKNKLIIKEAFFFLQFLFPGKLIFFLIKNKLKNLTFN
jgi:hypothetical protein